MGGTVVDPPLRNEHQQNNGRPDLPHWTNGANDHRTGRCRERPGATAVLLCDEHTLFLRGIRGLLAETSDLCVCREVSDLSDLDDVSGSPDVVAHGLVFSDAVGPVVVRRVREAFPRAALLVVTRLANPLYVHLCLSAGANGYISKSASPEEFLTAVRAVARGDEFVEPTLGAAVARWHDALSRQRRGSHVALTEREREVLELLAGGHTNAETAATLGIALRTAEAHRAHISQKLGLQRRADFVRYASEHLIV